ncbi:MAG: tol-pal system-associated acyl-CoA thioesterase [Rhodospirillales bacterium]|nr:tol-pal system-associated acyl-CoA thioesterase [Rhodospirillales bacterium]
MSNEAAHVFAVRVYYEDTDAAGIVYYANYLKYAERARTEMMRALGVENSRIRNEKGILFVVRDCAMDFRHPARLDDQLEVHTRLTDVGGASFSGEQRVKRNGEDLVTIQIRLACMTATGQPARMPKDLRAQLNELLNKNNGSN